MKFAESDNENHRPSKKRTFVRKVVPKSVMAFWERTTDPDSAGQPKLGRDLYLYTFPVQLVLLVYVLLGWSSFAERGESIGSSVSSNSLSGRMVLHFFYVIAVIVADRLAYFMRLLWLKAVAHIVAVVYVHVLVFVNIPKDTNVDFEDNPPLIGFYLVFAVYALLSSAQLFLGYARSPPEDTLKSRFDKPFPQLLKAYLAVPFLRELRQLLDWMASPTSLRLEDHMQFESMYTDLYLSRFEWLKDNVIPRKRTKFFKTTSGGSIFCVLMLVLLLPLLIFSDLNPITDRNDVTAVQIEFQVKSEDVGAFTLYSTSRVEQLVPFSRMDPDRRAVVIDLVTKSEDRDVTQFIRAPVDPETTWSVTPSTVSGLLDVLDPVTSSTVSVPTVLLTSTFTRPGPPDEEVVTYEAELELDPALRTQLFDALSTFTAGQQSSAPVTIPGLLHFLLRLPGSATVVDLTDEPADVVVRLNRGTTALPAGATLQDMVEEGVSLWWSLERPGTAGGVEMYTVSNEIAPSALTAALGSSGILAIYLTVVLAVGRLARDALGNPSNEIIYSEMPDPRDLLELAAAVVTARFEEYPGHLQDENHLYDLLVNLFRSPELLIRLTREKEDSPDPK